MAKIAKAGIVGGYSDKSFQGNKAMTRYEFAGELNRLGGRVAKVEAKTNTWIGGNGPRINTANGGFDQTAVGNLAQPYNVSTHGTDNVNVLILAYQNGIAKNLIASLEYQDFKIKNEALPP